jgi:hypothetical protein
VGRWLSEKGRLEASGWAINERAGLPAHKVFLVREGKVLADTPVDHDRPDVAEALGNELFMISGWKLEIPGNSIGLGELKLEIYAVMTDGMSVVKLGAKSIRVSPVGVRKTAPDSSFERIIASRLLRQSSSVPDRSAEGNKWPKMNVEEAEFGDGWLKIKGWALSSAGIKTVKVYMDKKFLGNCFLGYYRPDVRAAYPYVSDSERSGFLFVARISKSGDKIVSNVDVLVEDRQGQLTTFPKPIVLKKKSRNVTGEIFQCLVYPNPI